MRSGFRTAPSFSAGSAFDALRDRAHERRGDPLPDALGRLNRTAAFDLAQHGEDQRRRQLRDRNGADQREHIAFETADDVVGMDGRPLRPGVLVPLARHPFEGLTRRLDVRFDPELLCDGGIMPLAQLCPRLVALRTGVGE